MEKKEIQEWRDRLIKMFGVYHSDGQEYVTCPLCGINLDELANHIIKELDRAREEVEDKFREKYKKREKELNIPYSAEDGKEFWQGYQEGYHQGLKDMVVDTHYLDEEFQSKLAGII